MDSTRRRSLGESRRPRSPAIRASTRITFPSTAASSAPNAMLKIAAAV